MALIKEYFELTNKYSDDYGENTILLMMVGSFFEVYGILNKSTGAISGSKIVDFGKICELNIVEKNVCIGKDNVVMAGFKDMMIEKYIKKSKMLVLQQLCIPNNRIQLQKIFHALALEFSLLEPIFQVKQKLLQTILRVFGSI